MFTFIGFLISLIFSIILDKYVHFKIISIECILSGIIGLFLIITNIIIECLIDNLDSVIVVMSIFGGMCMNIPLCTLYNVKQVAYIKKKQVEISKETIL